MDTIKAFEKITMMILDDFLLLLIIADAQQDLLILLRARDEDCTSTIVCSQISLEAGMND
ncbi:MAG: hypothetical protein GXX92_12615 [Clostridiales bacterium]|nr:hypothetical protein [Clostridiales bacterium]